MALEQVNDMLSEKLKEHTKAAHIKLEKVLVQKIKSIKDIDDYLEILVYFYQFFNPLERAIFSQLDGRLPDVVERRKTDWILEDINFFCPSRPAIPPNHHMPGIDSSFQAMGALYVIEGSTLGGQMICKMVAKRLGISPESGFKFFSGYGEDTARMWAEFKDFMNSNHWTLEEEREVIDTADRTFGLFKQAVS